jgi:hypothetical protein
MIDISCRIHQSFLKNAAAVFAAIIVIGSGFCPDPVSAREIEDKTYAVGMRVGNLFEVDDIPVNSLPMVVCYVSRRLDSSWSAVLSLDSFVFDVEETADVLGLPTAEETEAFGKMSLIAASLDYVLCQEVNSFPIQPYVQAGVGIGFADFEIDDMDSGDGGSKLDIDIDTDGKVEVVPTVSLGMRYAFKSRWFFDAGTRFDYHISHWTIKERNSGREVRIDHFTALGAYAGFGVNF